MTKLLCVLLTLLISLSGPAMGGSSDFGRWSNTAKGTVGKTIGLGLEEDLFNLRGTGAITYKNGGWQQAGL
jgi:hypothetical protein